MYFFSASSMLYLVQSVLYIRGFITIASGTRSGLEDTNILGENLWIFTRVIHRSPGSPFSLIGFCCDVFFGGNFEVCNFTLVLLQDLWSFITDNCCCICSYSVVIVILVIVILSLLLPSFLLLLTLLLFLSLLPLIQQMIIILIIVSVS